MIDRLPDLADVLVESLKLAKRLNQSVHLRPSTAEAILAELRTRPAETQGLTAEEREALRPAIAAINTLLPYCSNDWADRYNGAIAVLDRLLSCSEVRR